MNRQQQEIEREIFEALDRVAQGETTMDDVKLLAAASGVRWAEKKGDTYEHSNS